jgi:hypothetical protein
MSRKPNLLDAVQILFGRETFAEVVARLKQGGNTQSALNYPEEVNKYDDYSKHENAAALEFKKSIYVYNYEDFQKAHKDYKNQTNTIKETYSFIKKIEAKYYQILSDYRYVCCKNSKKSSDSFYNENTHKFVSIFDKIGDINYDSLNKLYTDVTKYPEVSKFRNINYFLGFKTSPEKEMVLIVENLIEGNNYEQNKPSSFFKDRMNIIIGAMEVTKIKLQLDSRYKKPFKAFEEIYNFLDKEFDKAQKNAILFENAKPYTLQGRINHLNNIAEKFYISPISLQYILIKDGVLKGPIIEDKDEYKSQQNIEGDVEIRLKRPSATLDTNHPNDNPKNGQKNVVIGTTKAQEQAYSSEVRYQEAKEWLENAKKGIFEDGNNKILKETAQGVSIISEDEWNKPISEITLAAKKPVIASIIADLAARAQK